MKHFYTVHPTTTAGRDASERRYFFYLKFCSHTGETINPDFDLPYTHTPRRNLPIFMRGNKEATIVGVGNYLTELLQQKGL